MVGVVVIRRDLYGFLTGMWKPIWPATREPRLTGWVVVVGVVFCHFYVVFGVSVQL